MAVDNWTPILEIANATGLSLYSPADPPPIECSRAFTEAYREYADARESHLLSRSAAPALRGGLDFTTRMVQVAQQICWYYDELLLPDPLQCPPDLALDERDRLALIRNYRAVEAMQTSLAAGLVSLRARHRVSSDLALPESLQHDLRSDEAVTAAALDSADYYLREATQTTQGRGQEYRVRLGFEFAGGWKVHQLAGSEAARQWTCGPIHPQALSTSSGLLGLTRLRSSRCSFQMRRRVQYEARRFFRSTMRRLCSIGLSFRICSLDKSSPQDSYEAARLPRCQQTCCCRIYRAYRRMR